MLIKSVLNTNPSWKVDVIGFVQDGRVSGEEVEVV